MGIFFGSGLALIVGGLIIGAVGSWRLTFLIVGLPGLLAACLLSPSASRSGKICCARRAASVRT